MSTATCSSVERKQNTRIVISLVPLLSNNSTRPVEASVRHQSLQINRRNSRKTACAGMGVYEQESHDLKEGNKVEDLQQTGSEQ